MLGAQFGVISLEQARGLGISRGAIRSQLAAGRWTSLSPGVFFAVNGQPGQRSRWWAALLACGDGAVLSHCTAAELRSFGRWWTSSVIDVSIPEDRKENAVPGVRVRRSRLLPAKASVYAGFPVTSAADTVLDLTAELRSPHAVVGLLTDACRSKSVAPAEILESMAKRRRQRHRQLVKDVLHDVRGGVESVLEHRYLTRVERAHGLPPGRRQKPETANGGAIRRDVCYDDYATVVELDGRAGHEGSGQHRDRRRDNATTRGGKATLRYGHADVQEACETAAEVADVLRQHGWMGPISPCGPRCTALR